MKRNSLLIRFMIIFSALMLFAQTGFAQQKNAQSKSTQQNKAGKTNMDEKTFHKNPIIKNSNKN